MPRSNAPVPIGQLSFKLPPSICGNILKEVLKNLGSASKSFKTSARVLSIVQSDAKPLDCSQCTDVILRHVDIAPVQNWFDLTAINLTFTKDCRLEQEHVASSFCKMKNLRHLALFGTTSDESQVLYSRLAKQAQFKLESFGSDSDIVEGLLKFLATQPNVIECSLLPKFNVPFKTRKSTIYTALSNVKILQATAIVLTEAQFDLRSVRRLEYVGDSNQLDDQIRAVARIFRLGPQLEVLRFRWDEGKCETFLDVTKFAEIAKCIPRIRHLELINVDKNVSGTPPPYISTTNDSVRHLKALSAKG